jgi:hypothetical protein
MSRPVNITTEHLEYKDDLRESGDTNMFGAGTYVEAMFDVGSHEANAIVGYWMESFGKEDR